MEQITLRRATPADIAPLNALIEASVRRLAVGFYDAQQIESSLQHMFGVDSQLVNDGTYFVIEVNGVRAACGGWSGRQTLFGGDRHKAADHRGSDAPVDPAAVPARIRAFFVHPEYARRGLARRLYEHCVAEARGAGFVSLELMGRCRACRSIARWGSIRSRLSGWSCPTEWWCRVSGCAECSETKWSRLSALNWLGGERWSALNRRGAGGGGRVFGVVNLRRSRSS
jgi:GNAT superfamily N-acetyltransferase